MRFFVLFSILFHSVQVWACSCATNEPFLKVAGKAPLIVVGKVVAHEGKSRAGGPLVMEVKIQDLWKGQYGAATLRVQGGDGWLCRPEVGEFPVGSEWVLALNGPGSKPGTGPNFALSSCGQYWLRVEKDRAVGRIFAPEAQTALPLVELKSRLLSPAPLFSSQTFEGKVKAGERFRQEFGGNFVFLLEPGGGGWEIVVQQKGREENLARLTPPLHFAPNPRFLEPAHFFAPEKQKAEGNFPGKEREFLFSPEVGRRIAGPQAKQAPTADDIEAVRQQGRGTLTVLEIQGKSKRIDTMRFQVDLTWQNPGPDTAK